MCRHAGAGTSMNSMPNSRKRACLFVVAVSLLMASALSLTTMSSAWSAGRGDVVVHTSSTPDEDLLTESDAVTTSSNLAAHEGITQGPRKLLSDVDNFDAHQRTIFFFELAKVRQLSAKHLCALESAAFHNPNLQVVAAINALELEDDCITKAVLQKYHNQIRLLSLDPEKWIRVNQLTSETNPANDTFIKKLIAAGELSQISDYLRYITLFKYGGIYLDFDVIVLRPLGELRNALGLQRRDFVNQAMVILDKGHEFLKDCIAEFEKRYEPDARESSAAYLVTHLVQREKWCPRGKFPRPPPAGDAADSDSIIIRCNNGLNLLPTSAVYPVPREAWFLLFDVAADEGDRGPAAAPGNNDGQRADSETERVFDHIAEYSYALHLWNHESAKAEIRVGSRRQVVARVAETNCPVVFQALVRQQQKNRPGSCSS